MIVDRTHLVWGIATVAATAGVTVIYLANNDPGALPFNLALPGWLGPVPPLRGNVGATPLGLIYGTLALAIFIFAALLGWRRSHPSWKVGRIQVWLKAHIWLTIFTIPLVLLHGGFQGGGPMTQGLLWLYAFVMASGFWGLALQNIVPRIMRESLSSEVIYDQIPHLRAQLAARAQVARNRLVASQAFADAGHTGQGGTTVLEARRTESVSSVIRFIDGEAMPYLAAARPGRLRLRGRSVAADLFRLIRGQVPEALHAELDEIRDLCDEKRRLDAQARLHHWLHGWLIVHAPASILLVVMTIWHAIVAAYTYA